MKLSKRLEAIADFVSPGNSLCDVGCDHGFIPIYLVQSGKIPSALAMDINEGPLKACMEHVKEADLTDRITTRLSNGLCHYGIGEAKSLVIAGMGGPLICKILSDEKAYDFEELILEPQSELRNFRLFLKENGFHILDENLVCEDGKYYPIMKACPKERLPEGTEIENRESEELELRFGPVLLKKKHPVLVQYLTKQLEIQNRIFQQLKNHGSEENHGGESGRLSGVVEEIRYIEKALEICNR